MKKLKLQEVKKHISNLIREQETEREKLDTKSVSGLANQFLAISKGLRKGEYKGLQTGEINEIDDLIAIVLQLAMEGNVMALIKRLEVIVNKRLKPLDPLANVATTDISTDTPASQIPGDDVMGGLGQ